VLLLILVPLCGLTIPACPTSLTFQPLPGYHLSIFEGDGLAMKKIIFIDRVKQNISDPGLFDDLSDLELLTAYANPDALRIHRKEKASLIITELYDAGMSALQFCAVIREDEELRDVSIIVCCRDNEVERGEAEQCRGNAVLTLPLGRTVLRDKVRELLSIPSRKNFPTRFSARTGGTARSAVDCRVENISVTGMLIAADIELHRGDTLQYSLDLAPARSFAMQAEVVRAERGRYGVRFSRIDPAARRAIEVLVSQSPSVR
jgi:CheY-like chemotaxis protein